MGGHTVVWVRNAERFPSWSHYQGCPVTTKIEATAHVCVCIIILIIWISGKRESAWNSECNMMGIQLAVDHQFLEISVWFCDVVYSSEFMPI
jgi:hypothetical protein